MALKNNSAKFAFFYMFSLVALLFMALGTGQVFFQAINKFIPDFTAPYANGFNSDLLKFAISALIISTPLYYIMMRFLEKSLIKGALDRESAIRRWLTYFILFVSSVVMVIWLIVTISNFLNGELTSKFILKAAVAIVIAGIIFSYYLYDIRRESIKRKDTVVRIFLIGSLVITVGSLIFSLFFVESPAQARARRHDLIVLDHFTQIDSALSAYLTKTKTLPDTLAKAAAETPYINLLTLKDPVAGTAYDYKKVDDDTYQLCATFQTDNRSITDQANYTYSDRWPHTTGYQCLQQNVIDYGVPGDQGGLIKVPAR